MTTDVAREELKRVLILFASMDPDEEVLQRELNNAVAVLLRGAHIARLKRLYGIEPVPVYHGAGFRMAEMLEQSAYMAVEYEGETLYIPDSVLLSL